MHVPRPALAFYPFVTASAAAAIRDPRNIRYLCLHILENPLQSVGSFCVVTLRDHCLSHICEPAFSEMPSAPYHRQEPGAGGRFAACARAHVEMRHVDEIVG